MTEPTITTQSTVSGAPSSAPTNKTLAGAAGGTIATAVVTLLGYAFFTYAWRGTVPDEVHNAIMTILTGLIVTAGSFVTAYLTPHGSTEGIQHNVAVPVAPAPAVTVVDTVTSVQQPAGPVPGT